MAEQFNPDFLFSRIKGLSFNGAWAVIYINSSTPTNGRGHAELDFPETSGGTPGIFMQDASGTNPRFHVATGVAHDPNGNVNGFHSYAIKKGDTSSKLRTDAGKTIAAFGVRDPADAFGANLFVQLNNVTKTMRVNFSGGADAGFVFVRTYTKLDVGTVFDTIDRTVHGPAIGTDTHKKDQQEIGGADSLGPFDIDIDLKKLTISLS